MFAKVFSQIFDSSIAESHEVRHIFMDLLVLADATGVVDMTMHAISRRINVPLESVKLALEKLASPDPLSRSAKEEGRRIVLIDSHRDWGWQIVNYEHYRKTQDEEARRSYFRDYRKAEREKSSDKKKARSTPFKSVQPCSTPFKNVTQEEGEVEAKEEVKEHSERGLKFAEWFKDQLPPDMKLAPTWKKKWAKCFDDMMRLDNRTAEEIFAVCKWAREDARFWAKNFLTASKLRECNKDGVQYFDVFLANMASARAVAEPPAPPVKQKTRHDFIKAWETKHNHDYLNYPHDEHNKPIPAYILGEADYKAYLAEQNGK